MPEAEYEGRPVRKHSLAIRGVGGDALSGVLKVKPQDFDPDTPIYLLLEVVPSGVKHDAMDETDELPAGWERVQITKVKRSTILDAETAVPHLDALDVALEDLRISETGQERLDLEAPVSQTRLEEHARGLHKRKRKDCPACQGSDEGLARVDELAAKRAAHGDGEGDQDNPLPPARKRRSRAPKR